VSLRLLHRRLAATMAFAATLAFVSGAGLDAPAAWLALGVLALAALRPAGIDASRRSEPLWKIAAIVLAVRAAYAAFFVAEDVVLPMVDLLLVLLCAEALRPPEHGHDGRLYSLSIALIIAASAYRPGVLFPISFAAFVVTGTVALAVGHLSRTAERHRLRPVPVLPRHFVYRIAGMSALCLVMAAIVFVAFPRASQAWVGRGAVVETAIVGFSDQVSIGTHGTRIHANPAVALRVEFPGGGAERAPRLYWRGRSYDHFDGVRWSRTRTQPVREPPRRRRAAADIEQRIYGVPLTTPVLFGLPEIRQIVPNSRILPVREFGGDFTYLGGAPPVYTVRSAAMPPPAAELRAGLHVVPPALDAYLQLPPTSPALRQLADSIAASATTAYDRVRATERWFHQHFGYTLELPRTGRETSIEHFLFVRREGHCEYFSTAMVVLLRAQGIAARNVNGFLGGEWNEFGNFLTVTQNQAHSWVEVWFPGHGWVTFDPTPTALGVAADAAGTGWLHALRRLSDGLEHRWSKWVLDYDLTRQSELTRLAVESIAGTPEEVGHVDRFARFVRAAAMITALLLLTVLLRVVHSRSRAAAGPRQEAARVYLALRRAYAAAGFAVPPSVPPLAFARALALAGAPGAEHARRAVRAYVEVRFGAGGGASIDELRAATQRARKGLRRRREPAAQSSASGSLVRG
jgi:protein-glutamine gamma-glutamyltransferase